ncbi:MAG: hypothetical protein J6T70_10260, partial [Bacteroidales bacterium]|nr:hypothetical protein [Bacteroidales bacterium]
GTIRNRLNKVYDILGVMDRMGFISTYMGCNIIFENFENKKTIKTEKKLLNKYFSIPNNINTFAQSFKTYKILFTSKAITNFIN